MKGNQELTKIKFLVVSSKNMRGLERIFGEKIAKQMLKEEYSYKSIPTKIETLKTYETKTFSASYEVVICCGLSSDEIFNIQDFSQIGVIITITWLKEKTQEWIKIMKARKINEDLSTEENTEDTNFEKLSKAVKNAFEDLSENINHTTGIIHHHDEHRAKTYIRALHKYEKKLDSDVILSFLILNLGWEYRFAKDVKKLIDTLNNGKYFQGGETKELKNYYDRWAK